MSLLIDALKKAEKSKQDSSVATADNESEPISFSSTVTDHSAADPSDDTDILGDHEPLLETDQHCALSDGFAGEPTAPAFGLEPTSSRAPMIPLADTVRIERATPTFLEMEPVAPMAQSHSANTHSERPIEIPANPAVEHYSTPSQAANEPYVEPKDAIVAPRTTATIKPPYQPGVRQHKLQLVGAAVLGLALLIVAGGYYFVTALNSIGGSQAFVASPVPSTPETVPSSGQDATTATQNDMPVAQPAVQPSIENSTLSQRQTTDSNVHVAKPSTTSTPRASMVSTVRQSVNPTAAPKAEAKQPLNIVMQQIEDPVSVLLNQGYQAYVAGNFALAQQHYQSVLQRSPSNRDALLGLAVIAHRGGQPESARQYYQSLLRLNPKDTQAMAGLIALQDVTNPELDEARLKLMIDQQPEAAYLHYALGNLYVNQSRWAEAQQSFFRAHHFQPDNADYAFNLAVSLDQLRQSSPALQYYRLALQLQQAGNASFNNADVIQRIAVLTQANQQGAQP